MKVTKGCEICGWFHRFNIIKSPCAGCKPLRKRACVDEHFRTEGGRAGEYREGIKA